MIILPDRNTPRARLLLPVPVSEWREPSQRSSFLGMRFRLTARLHDGHIAWRGWFDDRGDADAFLYALASGSLGVERALWRLPTPHWHPDLNEGVVYEFTSTAYLTTGATNITAPSDWNSSNNFIHCIASGGSGAGGTNGGAGGGNGGGGGAWSRVDNLSMTPGSTTLYMSIGAGKTGGAQGTGGTAGDDTWVNKSANSAPGSTSDGALAKGGGAGTVGSGSQPAGGAAASGVGSSKQSGGSGSNIASSANAGGGGGGAGGPNGAGANGSNASGANGGAGGTGDGGGVAGGAASTSGNAGNAGSAGTSIDGAKGPGGGGGGGPNTTGNVGGAGGNYGGAGGGGGRTGGGTGFAGGNSAQGLVVLIWTPATLGLRLNFPMLGM